MRCHRGWLPAGPGSPGPTAPPASPASADAPGCPSPPWRPAPGPARCPAAKPAGAGRAAGRVSFCRFPARRESPAGDDPARGTPRRTGRCRRWTPRRAGRRRRDRSPHPARKAASGPGWDTGHPTTAGRPRPSTVRRPNQPEHPWPQGFGPRSLPPAQRNATQPPAPPRWPAATRPRTIPPPATTATTPARCWQQGSRPERTRHSPSRASPATVSTYRHGDSSDSFQGCGRGFAIRHPRPTPPIQLGRCFDEVGVDLGTGR